MKKDKLKKLRLFYLILIIMLVLSAFTVPFLFLSSYNTFSGAFLYWLFFSLIVIFLTIKIISYWRE